MLAIIKEIPEILWVTFGSICVALIANVWGKQQKAAISPNQQTPSIDLRISELSKELNEQRQSNVDLRDLNFKLTLENQELRAELNEVQSELNDLREDMFALRGELLQLKHG